MNGFDFWCFFVVGDFSLFVCLFLEFLEARYHLMMAWVTVCAVLCSENRMNLFVAIVSVVVVMDRVPFHVHLERNDSL